MPVPKGKRNANQHDKRHENGLAAPGKRIQKQKSNPQLNGNVNGRPSHPPTPPLPSDVAQHMTLPASPDQSTHGTLSEENMAGQLLGRSGEGRARAVSEISLDGLEACRYDNTNGTLDQAPQTPRRTDANIKLLPAYKSNMLTVATTILSSCPLRDVLAILIILLQLPPTVLTIVQFLFATLTFVPPQAGTSLSAISALPSLTDIFQGSGGTPSLFTIIFADLAILFLWLMLWVPIQNFFLDLAQAVIAIALGGAAAGKNGTTNSVFICFVIILSSHLFRFRPLRQHIVHFLWTGLARGGLDFLTSPPSVPSYSESFSTPHGWPRSLLGIHILAQGIVRIIRRSLSRREASSALPTGKRADPEAAVHSLPRSNSINLDSNPDPPSSSSTDGRPPGPSPAANYSKDKATTSRRKRKQATHVRSQQPFWAALASTKVTVLKEMEHSRSANDAGEANAKDANHIGNAVWSGEEDRVWIAELGAADITFRVVLNGQVDMSSLGEEEQVGSARPGIDKSKPFYVRVNGADWSSARIQKCVEHASMGVEGTGMWNAEIFGLTALSNYYCEFVRTVDDRVFYSASLITSAAPSAEQGELRHIALLLHQANLQGASASVASPPAHQALRPSSPTTTLKNSIAAADLVLQENRNRLKRNRKDHKTGITAIKREVDTLSNRLSTAGGSDERQRQRALQFNQNIRQAEDATADFALQIDSLGEIPEDEVEEANTMKRAWKKERAHETDVCNEFERAKAAAEREMASIQSDITSAIQKRERLQQRQSRLNEQHERLIAANNEGLSAKTKKQQDRLAMLSERMTIENQYRSNINSYERRAAENSLSTAQLHQTIAHYESVLAQQSVPTTPDGPLPGTTAATSSGLPAYSAAFQFPSLPEHMASSTPGSLRGGRGRSSSMLSNVSGFTEDGFEDAPSPTSGPGLNPFSSPFHSYSFGHTNGKAASHGSGSGPSSGTSSNSSSQRDPMSPVPMPASKPVMMRSPTSRSSGVGSPLGGG